MPPDVEKILHYRNRAEELRVQAEQVKTISARQSLLKMAADYDRMADRCEEDSDKDGE